MNEIKIPIGSFKAVIFDMDGTMINNTRHHIRAWQEFLKRHGIVLSDEEYRQKIAGKKNDDIVKILFGEHVSPEEAKRLGDEKESIYRELYAPDIKEVQGLKVLVEELQHRSVRLAIATTANSANRDFALDSLNLQGQFEIILGEEHVKNGKPDPEIYLSTAKKLGVEPRECLVFEDSPSGVEAAKTAGMTVVGLLTMHSPGELTRADYLIHDFSELEFA